MRVFSRHVGCVVVCVISKAKAWPFGLIREADHGYQTVPNNASHPVTARAARPASAHLAVEIGSHRPAPQQPNKENAPDQTRYNPNRHVFRRHDRARSDVGPK